MIQIGKISFSDKLKSLTWTNFKKYWTESGHEKDTGLTPVDAAKHFGIKAPSKDKKGD